jgi:hypothetical protein
MPTKASPAPAIDPTVPTPMEYLRAAKKTATAANGRRNRPIDMIDSSPPTPRKPATAQLTKPYTERLAIEGGKVAWRLSATIPRMAAASSAKNATNNIVCLRPLTRDSHVTLTSLMCWNNGGSPTSTARDERTATVVIISHFRRAHPHRIRCLAMKDGRASLPMHGLTANYYPIRLTTSG